MFEKPMFKQQKNLLAVLMVGLLGLALARNASAEMLVPGSALSRTEMISGTQSIVVPFTIHRDYEGGLVHVALADLAWPGLMSSLSFAASTSTSLLAQMAAPGSMTFAVSGGGTYFATVYGVADPAFGVGLYSLNLSYSPVPLPGAAWLLLSGLALLRRTQRPGKETVINAR